MLCCVTVASAIERSKCRHGTAGLQLLGYFRLSTACGRLLHGGYSEVVCCCVLC
jgi:hypothetical protein